MYISEKYLEEMDIAHLALVKGAKLAAWDTARYYNEKYREKHGESVSDAAKRKLETKSSDKKPVKALKATGRGTITAGQNVAKGVNYIEKKTLHEPVEGAKHFIKQSAEMTKHQAGEAAKKAKEGIKHTTEKTKHTLKVLGKRPQPATA